MISSLYLRLAGYLVLTALVFGSGYRVGSEAWKAKYEALQAADWEGKAQAQQARADALDAQIRGFKTVVQDNSRVENELRSQRDQAVGDSHRFAGDLDRLRQQTAGTRSSCRAVPATTDQSGAPAASPAPGDGQLDALLGATIAECRANTRQLNALSEEIRPQL